MAIDTASIAESPVAITKSTDLEDHEERFSDDISHKLSELFDDTFDAMYEEADAMYSLPTKTRSHGNSPSEPNSV